MKFRKKPIVIEAVTVREAVHLAKGSWKDLPQWLSDAYDRGEIHFLNHPSRVHIMTLEGDMIANIDDWIIQGVKGELYPCKPDIFGATYERVRKHEPPSQPTFVTNPA